MWRIIFTIIGLIALLALIWFLGPFIDIGGWAPLNELWEKIVASVVVISIFALVFLIRWLIRRRRARKLEDGIVKQGPQDDTPILKEKMEDALRTLRKSSRRGGSAALYDLPWYIIIGPPGAGKTTALINSGMKFPLSGPGGPRAVAGFGGTRHCDWWFTEEAVLIDTAGRYTTQDSDAAADAASWTGFVDLLKETRPRQPINGAIVCISITDIMGKPTAELNQDAAAIRSRLDELHQRLGVQFPVYVMFTKMDLIAGFMEFFGDLTSEQREIVWGHTFEAESKTENMVTQFPGEFDALMTQLAAKLTDRMQEEVDPRSRTLIFGFPAQMASLKGAINDFLLKVFEPTRYQADAVLRGVYFTSGTQEGTPFDRVLGALSRSFGASGQVQPLFSGQGKSFFLSDLLRRVIFLEQGWVGADMRHIRRKFLTKAALYVLLIGAVSGASALLINSYLENQDLITRVDRAVDEYRELAAVEASTSQVADSDFTSIERLLQKLRYLPAGYAEMAEDKDAPVSARFGLDQRPRVESANVQAYREGLKRYLLPRLILRLEDQLEANMNDPTVVYETLKVYLMLGGDAVLDPDLVYAWIKRDWETNLYRGAEYQAGRERLLEHLDALLERLPTKPAPGADPDPSLVQLNGDLVRQAQAVLARLPIADRAYTMMKSLAASAGFEDWLPAERGGPDSALVFETASGDALNTLRVPGFYTYEGFHYGVLGTMEAVVASVANESWVIGDAGGAAVDIQFETIRQDILDRYQIDFISAWDNVLSQLKLRSLTGGGGDLTVLNALAAPTSPLKQMLVSLREETEVTKPLPEGEGLFSGEAGGEAGERVGDYAESSAVRSGRTYGQRLAIEIAIGSLTDAAGPGGARANGAPLVSPGERIEAHFKQLHDFAGDASAAAGGAPGSAPVDQLISRFNNIYRQMTVLASSPPASVAAQAQAELQAEVLALQGDLGRMPGVIAGLAGGGAQELATQGEAGARERLGTLLANNVTPRCTDIIGNRYPFFANSTRDVAPAAFGQLFGHGGILDAYFSENLDSMVDRSGENWRWRSDVGIGRLLSNATLREFQRAAEIRDAYFPPGSPLPKVDFSVAPLTLSPEADSTTLTVDTGSVTYAHGRVDPQAMSWPGLGAGQASVSVTPELAGVTNRIVRTGAWAFHRLLAVGATLPQGDTITATFDVGGRRASFVIQPLLGGNPFTLRALRDFRCPSGF